MGNQKYKEIYRLANVLLKRLEPYWKQRAFKNTDAVFYRYEDTVKGKMFSGRLLSDILLGYLALEEEAQEGEHLETLIGLLNQIEKAQDVDGAFRWNLPDPWNSHPEGVRDQVDLAMVVDALSHLRKSSIPETFPTIRRIFHKALPYLRTIELPGHPGVVRKRDYDNGFLPDHDVLNGDALAAKAFMQMGNYFEEDALLQQTDHCLLHLKERFGKHYVGWWPYSESLDKKEIVPKERHGRSVFFQSMMLIHLREIAENPRFSDFLPFVEEGEKTIVRCVDTFGKIRLIHESRLECVGKPNALVAHCLTGANALEKAEQRLRCIADRCMASDGNVVDENQNTVTDIWKVWLFSDLARLVLSMRKAEAVHATQNINKISLPLELRQS